jgi:hypothetical protein
MFMTTGGHLGQAQHPGPRGAELLGRPRTHAQWVADHAATSWQ